MCCCGGADPGDDLALGPPDQPQPGLVVQLGAGIALELGKGGVGSTHKGDVVGVLEVRRARQARLAVGAAAVVTDPVLIDAQCPHPTARERGDGGAADTAQAHDDGVPVHLASTLAPSLSLRRRRRKRRAASQPPPKTGSRARIRLAPRAVTRKGRSLGKDVLAGP